MTFPESPSSAKKFMSASRSTPRNGTSSRSIIRIRHMLHSHVLSEVSSPSNSTSDAETFHQKQPSNVYTALLDCRLVHGAAISPDVDDAALSLLEAVQVSTLRRVLGLGTRSSTSVLFTELGLQPLRLVLCLSYLKYLVTLPPTHYARLALQVSEDLYNEHYSSWFGDLDRSVIASFATSVRAHHIFASSRVHPAFFYSPAASSALPCRLSSGSMKTT
ncbi:hypothetical protein BDZ89DRAFT_1260047 [Hymenopellis radicata]|nr:hypothetical protein BDZ89DRAFT_1260047 [Hymenopellis radicata]